MVAHMPFNSCAASFAAWNLFPEIAVSNRDNKEGVIDAKRFKNFFADYVPKVDSRAL